MVVNILREVCILVIGNGVTSWSMAIRVTMRFNLCSVVTALWLDKAQEGIAVISQIIKRVIRPIVAPFPNHAQSFGLADGRSLPTGEARSCCPGGASPAYGGMWGKQPSRPRQEEKGGRPRHHFIDPVRFATSVREPALGFKMGQSRGRPRQEGAPS